MPSRRPRGRLLELGERPRRMKASGRRRARRRVRARGSSGDYENEQAYDVYDVRTAGAERPTPMRGKAEHSLMVRSGCRLLGAAASGRVRIPCSSSKRVCDSNCLHPVPGLATSGEGRVGCSCRPPLSLSSVARSNPSRLLSARRNHLHSLDYPLGLPPFTEPPL